ncbi:hypothetical protein ACLB2K_057220 [Fragaria x ananassa]
MSVIRVMELNQWKNWENMEDKKAAELSKFPKEIMVEVLSRLPPKSLMRFKCVCKSWQCLISNSNFAAKHLSASKRNEHPSSTTIVLKRCDGDDIHAGKKEVLLSFFDLCQRLDGDNNDHELRPILEDLYSPLSPGVVDWQRFCVSISAHCDGILCLTDGVEYIVLCNPAIKEFKCLPVPSPKLNSCGGGFGYDLKSKDYKIVRILDNGNEEYKDGMRKRVVNHPPAAQIYNLLTSSWKEIKIIDNLITKTTIYWPQSHSIYRNGILYWCGREGFLFEPSEHFRSKTRERLGYHLGQRLWPFLAHQGSEVWQHVTWLLSRRF